MLSFVMSSPCMLLHDQLGGTEALYRPLNLQMCCKVSCLCDSHLGNGKLHVMLLYYWALQAADGAVAQALGCQGLLQICHAGGLSAKALPVMQIKLSPSLFIPNSQIGTFGAVTQFKSLVKNNTDMFDVSFAGPAAAAATSLALFVVGLAWSTGGDIPKVSPFYCCSALTHRGTGWDSSQFLVGWPTCCCLCLCCCCIRS